MNCRLYPHPSSLSTSRAVIKRIQKLSHCHKMSASQPPPLHVLRGILRHLKTKSDLVVDKNTPSSTRAFILQQYRANKSISSPEAVERLQTHAYNYYKLKADLAEREKLYELDRGAENKLSPRELSRRAAARAGLQLPEIDANLE